MNAVGLPTRRAVARTSEARRHRDLRPSRRQRLQATAEKTAGRITKAMEPSSDEQIPRSSGTKANSVGGKRYMSENSSPRRLLPAILTVLAFNAGCATVDSVTSTTTTGTTPTQDTKTVIEQWKCGDYFDGCGLFDTDCVTLTANLDNGTGEVRFGDIIETTRFEIQGIERRWDWCLNEDFSYDCAFFVSVDGTGSYYNFRGSDDGTAKPRDLFKCTKR